MFKSALLAGSFVVAVQATSVEAVADIETCNETGADQVEYCDLSKAHIYENGRVLHHGRAGNHLSREDDLRSQLDLAVNRLRIAQNKKLSRRKLGQKKHGRHAGRNQRRHGRRYGRRNGRRGLGEGRHGRYGKRQLHGRRNRHGRRHRNGRHGLGRRGRYVNKPGRHNGRRGYPNSNIRHGPVYPASSIRRGPYHGGY